MSFLSALQQTSVNTLRTSVNLLAGPTKKAACYSALTAAGLLQGAFTAVYSHAMVKGFEEVEAPIHLKLGALPLMGAMLVFALDKAHIRAHNYLFARMNPSCPEKFVYTAAAIGAFATSTLIDREGAPMIAFSLEAAAVSGAICAASFILNKASSFLNQHPIQQAQQNPQVAQLLAAQLVAAQFQGTQLLG